MAQGLKVGDRIYVPRARLGLSVDAPSAFVQTTVRAVEDRSVVVDLPGSNPPQSKSIASSAARSNIGVLIVRIGDFDTETTLLDPLAKSLLQFCRLLVTDEAALLREVRSRDELKRFWQQDHGAYSHLILVGHGRRDGIRFGHDDWISAGELATLLEEPDAKEKIVISLCCENGYAAFGQALSRGNASQAVFGPFDSIHGAVASQFCQTFLTYHLLQGETLKVASRHARAAVPGASSFRLWVNGRLETGG